MSLSWPQPENWPPSTTVCFGGGSLMSIREPLLMKSSTSRLSNLKTAAQDLGYELIPMIAEA